MTSQVNKKNVVSTDNVEARRVQLEKLAAIRDELKSIYSRADEGVKFDTKMVVLQIGIKLNNVVNALNELEGVEQV